MQCDLLELRDAHAKLRTTNEKLRREKDRLERDRDLLKQSINIKKKIEQEEERQIISVAQLVSNLTTFKQPHITYFTNEMYLVNGNKCECTFIGGRIDCFSSRFVPFEAKTTRAYAYATCKKEGSYNLCSTRWFINMHTIPEYIRSFLNLMHILGSKI